MRSAVALVTAGFLASCFMSDREMTGAPVASDIVGKCFALTSESMRIRFPFSKVDLLFADMDGRLQNDVALQKRMELRIMGTVPKGSPLIVSRVLDSFNGETARRWDVFATLRDPNGTAVEVQIPTYSGVDQGWLVEWRSDATRESGKAVQFKDKYLTPCAVATP